VFITSTNALAESALPEHIAHMELGSRDVSNVEEETSASTRNGERDATSVAGLLTAFIKSTKRIVESAADLRIAFTVETSIIAKNASSRGAAMVWLSIIARSVRILLQL